MDELLESLVREVVLRGSELAFAESQILEIQKELDAHKQECYGHMKVIQEMRFGKMQVESSMRTIKSSCTQQILDLQLELVKTKRALAKSEAEGCKVAEEKKELVLEHDRARAEFGIILANCETSKKSKKKAKTELPELEAASSATAALLSVANQVA